MGLPASLLFDDLGEPPDARALYALGQACHIAYFPDSTYDDAWANFFGFQSSHTEVTPGNELPNYTKYLHDDRCLFAIAGTTSMIQMLENVCYAGQRENIHFGIGHVHSFFLWLAEGLLPYIQADLASKPAARDLVFTGHSLGAAVAYLLASWFDNHPGWRVKNYVGFCSPRPAHPVFCSAPRGFRSYNIFNSGDQVQHCPPKAMVAFSGFTPSFFPDLVAEYDHPRWCRFLREDGSFSDAF